MGERPSRGTARRWPPGMPTRLVNVVVDAGATPVDIGQGDVLWVVLQDPEGAEFCVLTPR